MLDVTVITACIVVHLLKLVLRQQHAIMQLLLIH